MLPVISPAETRHSCCQWPEPPASRSTISIHSTARPTNRPPASITSMIYNKQDQTNLSVIIYFRKCGPLFRQRHDAKRILLLITNMTENNYPKEGWSQTLVTVKYSQEETYWKEQEVWKRCNLMLPFPISSLRVSFCVSNTSEYLQSAL